MSDCIEWEKCRHANGYGKVGIGGKTKYAHRVAYELEHGPIPEGMVVMHSCDNPPCINPEHLSLGTHADNVRDKTAKGRTPRGERHSSAKLSDRQVEEIRAKHSAGQRVNQLAREYGVSSALVSLITRYQVRNATPAGGGQ